MVWGGSAVFIAALILSVSACTGAAFRRPLVQPAVSTEVSKDYQPLRLNVIAVYPLELGQLGGRASLPDMLTTEEFVRVLDRESSFELLNATKPELVARALEKDNREKDASGKAEAKSLPESPMRVRALSFGKELKAQGVIYGRAATETAPSGSAFVASEQAQASLDLFLLDVEQAKIVWQARYHRSQQPLSENLFQLGNESNRPGFRFRSAAELLSQGFGQIAKILEKSRKDAIETGE